MCIQRKCCKSSFQVKKIISIHVILSLRICSTVFCGLKTRKLCHEVTSSVAKPKTVTIKKISPNGISRAVSVGEGGKGAPTLQADTIREWEILGVGTNQLLGRGGRYPQNASHEVSTSKLTPGCLMCFKGEKKSQLCTRKCPNVQSS